MGRHAAGRFLGVALAIPAGCAGGDVDPAPVCEAGPGLARPSPDSERLGTVRIRDERDTTLGPDGAPLGLFRGRITASFGRTTATSTPADALDLGDFCVGLVSRPRLGSAEPLEVARLSVNGTASGPIDVPSLGGGRFSYLGAPLLGATTLSVEGEQLEFPAFAERIEPVAAMSVLGPDPMGGAVLGLGPLDLAWVRGDSDAVVIEIAPLGPSGAPATGGQVFCRVADDGCHRLPESVTGFLRASSDRFVATLRRERTALTTPPGAAVVVEASSAWRFELGAEAP